jgi:glucose/arabinose dehydrogenase
MPLSVDRVVRTTSGVLLWAVATAALGQSITVGTTFPDNECYRVKNGSARSAELTPRN